MVTTRARALRRACNKPLKSFEALTHDRKHLIKTIVEKYKNGKVKKICLLTGAGVSVSSGIPDFRSPGGMYDTLQPELLTASAHERLAMHEDPTYVVSMDLFENNQVPYLELRRPFILGVAEKKWKPTIAHAFAQILDRKGMLTRLYTQNIDGLDYQLGIDPEKIVAVHGSLGRVECEFCQAEMETDVFRSAVAANIKDIYDIDKNAPKSSSNIHCPHCKMSGVKPATVLYGGNLPGTFFECMERDKDAVDLLFVCGTSLTVYPAASLPEEVSDKTTKCLVNLELVGSEVDVFLQGKCDEVFLEMIHALGWMDDLLNLDPKDTLCKNSNSLIQAFEAKRKKAGAAKVG